MSRSTLEIVSLAYGGDAVARAADAHDPKAVAPASKAKDGIVQTVTVKRLCESHGGAVGVRSVLGTGSLGKEHVRIYAELAAAGKIAPWLPGFFG